MGSEVIPMLDSGTEDQSSQRPFLTNRYIRFGAFILDQHRQELFRNGTRLKVQGKAYQVLLTLIERAGEVVTREELRQRLWPSDTHVNFDANVNTTVNKLRQALGDSPEEPVYIETIPRKGYSFVAAVEPAEAPSPVRTGHPAVVPPPPEGASAGKQFWIAANRSTIWIAISMVALLGVGMLLGAGLATLWIAHASRVISP